MKIIKNPKHYIEQPLQLVAYDWEPKQQIRYPICMCGDAILKCVHSTDFESVNSEWERRKQRIDWNNLFVMMATENKELAEEFSNLQYQNKVCFVPFKTEKEFVFSMDIPKKFNNIFDYLNEMAKGKLLYYDAVELLYSSELRRF